MKITLFNGSPKAEKGNTHVMAEEFAQGAVKAGAEVETVFLVRKNIKHCMGCFHCWFTEPGVCVTKDDMRELLVKFASSDIVVFATPLHVDNVTGIMKNFIDRLVPLADPRFEKDENGECRHILRIAKPPKIAVISNCGFPEQSHFQVLKLLFRRMARNLHSEVIAEIYRGGGAILSEAPLLLKPMLWKYKSHLRRAGGEVAGHMKISEATAAGLEAKIVPDKFYIAGANKSFDRVLSKKG